MMNITDSRNVIDKRKLTWNEPNGTWGLKNYDIHDVPKELYGPLYKLHNYEKTGLSPEEVEDLKEKKQSNSWIPCNEQLPENDNYILVSFDNFSLPDIGRYEEDKEGGAFYPGDEDKSYSAFGLFVNAWRPLPESYREEGENE